FLVTTAIQSWQTKDFKIQDLLSKISVKLNIPPFLSRGHFTEEEVQETEEITSLRI
ncbi:hypothetical protein HPB47_010411, partial [Ixodes persulcatus]